MASGLTALGSWEGISSLVLVFIGILGYAQADWTADFQARLQNREDDQAWHASQVLFLKAVSALLGIAGVVGLVKAFGLL